MNVTLDDELISVRRANVELQQRLDERTKERDEALQRETAIAEILEVINSSPGDLAPVFEAILERALRLCEATHGHVWRFDDELLHAAAARGDPQFVEWLRQHSSVRPIPGSAADRIVRGERLVHVADRREESAYLGDPIFRGLVDTSGVRTSLSVSLRRDETLLGMINVYRQEVRPFSDKQIGLLQNFAAQAVIAMENARLLGELRQRTSALQESLEYQTATSDVLKVISRSTFDLQPVLDTLAETAARLCDAGYSAIFRRDGEVYRIAAVIAFSPETMDAARKFQTFLEQHPLVPGRGSITGRVAVEGHSVHVADTASDPEYTLSEATTLGNLRTQLGVPLLREGEPVGVIVVARQRVEPFTERQVELVHTFADQAVIAMENARLITETRESLEQQTATAEVLQVINRSPGELQPVFEAILEKAHSLCGVSYGSLQLYDGEKFRAVAMHGLSGALADRLRQGYSPGPTNPLRRLLEGERFVHTPDLAEIDDPITNSVVELLGTRTLLCVALRKDKKLLGLIAAVRLEVRPFSDKQIALLENFAAQAVIAMENARLITETREALEQQTATAEVLRVINSSPGDLQPVFDAMLERATTLCESAHGALFIGDGESNHFQAIPSRGTPKAFAEFLTREPVYFDPERSILAQTLRQRSAIEIADMRLSEPYRYKFPLALAAVESGGTRTLLSVPLVRDDVPVGIFQLARQEVRPFSDKQIALVSNFAAQAVIAIENTRLITETREALEQQTATAEVLQVINSSPGDLSPVFDAILEKAHTLCGIDFGALQLNDGGKFRSVAARGLSETLAEVLRRPFEPVAGSPPSRLLGGERIVHVADMAELAQRPTGDARAQAVAQDGFRTGLFVPLRKHADLLGYIVALRREVRLYSDKEIALLENFAAQAVIAMENARLITETREALEQQTATAEVLQVINSSPGDLAPVFDAMLERAMRLCEAKHGYMYTHDGELLRTTAVRGEPQFVEFMRGREPVIPGTPLERALRSGGAVYIADCVQEEVYRTSPGFKQLVDVGGIRTGIILPLFKEAAFLGSIHIFRQEVRPFSDKQIALLQNFAAQAVIAMENARLLTETREALEQQTATAEVLQVINSSPGNLTPVFDAMLDEAMSLCDAAFGGLFIREGERFQAAATRGLAAEFDAFVRTPFTPGPDSTFERAIRGETIVHIPDIALARVPENPQRMAVIDQGSARTVLQVSLDKDGELLGVFSIFRQEVRPFSDKQITLLQNFAAQAVIAMENARLLDEIRQRQQELRVTFDNMVDGVAMFDTELRLAAWNRNFQQLLDLPDEFLTERLGFDTYIRYLTERGEFGESDPDTEIKRLRARIGDHYSFERTRPDGTVIEVRHNPMPDGGIVLIYSDITERKRSEAEIHAARDAAEAAYRDLKAAQANLIQVEKMASLGQLTAGIAHEIKNPLNFVNNFAGLSVALLDELKEAAAPAITALDEDKRAEIDETIEMLTGNLEKITEHGRRADNIVKSMLEHSRGSSGERRSVDLNGLIEEALNLAYHGGRAQDQNFNVTLEREYAAALPAIELVPQEITRVCLNLFTNGFYATTKRQREGGDPNSKPTLRVTTRDLGEAVEVRIRDNGVGIPPEIKDKLFQPFFTTKPTGEGTGLGLSISYDIVTQQHGGAIEVDSRVGEYTEFTVRLPRRHRTILGEAAS